MRSEVCNIIPPNRHLNLLTSARIASIVCGNNHLYNVRSQLITLFCYKGMASGFVKHPNCIKIYFSVRYTATSWLRSPLVATSNIISPRSFHSATKNLSNQSLASLTMKGVIQCSTPGSAMNLNFSETLALL